MTTDLHPASSSLAPDPSSDVLHVDRHPLDALFQPRSVAVIGATEKAGSVGRTILWNLICRPFGGTVYPGQPEASGDPRHQGLPVARRDRRSGRPRGHRHAGPDRARPHRRVRRRGRPRGRDHQCRVQGDRPRGRRARAPGPGEGAPRRDPRRRPELPRGHEPGRRAERDVRGGHRPPGRVGFVSQTGALLTAVLDWAARESVGFSSIVSLGSMLDVGWGDVIDYLGDDPNTDSILIYMETIGDARAFLSAAREVALTKPIIVIKPGRTAQAAKAAASHTGSLTGSDDVLDAAFRRAGVLRVDRSPTCSRRRGAGQAAAPGGPAPDDRDQRRRPGRARDRRADRRRRRADRRCRRTRWPRSTRVLPPSGATTTPSTSSATRRPSGTPRRSRSPPPTRPPTGCWSSSRRRR